MKSIILVLLLLLVLTGCTRFETENTIPTEEEIRIEATANNPFILESNSFEIAVSKSIIIHAAYYNTEETQTIGFGTELQEKDTITCFTLEGTTAKMVLRMPVTMVEKDTSVPISITLEDKSGLTPGRMFSCSIQIYNQAKIAIQQDFDVTLT